MRTLNDKTRFFRPLLCAASVAGLMALAACDDRPDSVGEAVEQAGDAVEDAADKAGDAIDDAARRIDDSTDRAPSP